MMIGQEYNKYICELCQGVARYMVVEEIIKGSPNKDSEFSF